MIYYLIYKKKEWQHKIKRLKLLSEIMLNLNRQNYIIKEIIVSKEKIKQNPLWFAYKRKNTSKAKPHIKTEYVEC